MRNFQDTFETCKRSFISVFFSLHDCTFKSFFSYVNVISKSFNAIEKIREITLQHILSSHYPFFQSSLKARLFLQFTANK